MKLAIIIFWIILYLTWSVYSIKDIIDYLRTNNEYSFLWNYSIAWIVFTGVMLGASSIIYLVIT